MADPPRAPARPKTTTSPEAGRARAPEHPRLREAIETLDLVARSMMRQVGGRIDIDDLKSFAHEAVGEVLERFDEKRGVAFRAYARLRFRGAMIDALRKESGMPRGVAARLRALEAADLYVQEKSEEHGAATRPGSAAAADAKIAGFLRGLATAYATGLVTGDSEQGASNPEDADDPEENTRRSQARALLDRALDEIGDPEGALLRRHYFLDEDLQDAAAHLGLSKSWGSRLHARGIEKLAERLRALREEL